MNTFSENTLNRGGDKGRQWLEFLPGLVNDLAKKWHLTDLKPMADLSYNYVLTAYQGNPPAPVVLKIGLEVTEVRQEMAALQFYQGQGCVKLLDADLDKGALLLEAIEPGITLKRLFPKDDATAVTHAVQVMKRLHSVPLTNPSDFPTLADLLDSLFKAESSVLPEAHLKKAQTLAKVLLSSQAAPVLLHSDLHHDNILFSVTEGWIAIDPRGVIGEPAFEIGTFIYNPIPDLLAQNNASAIIAHRLNLFAELLEMDPQRLKDWAYVQAILSACWHAEDGNLDDYAIHCAMLIEKV
jgi:streptomycin 6-kinase